MPLMPKHVPVPADRTAEIANGAIDMFIERLEARGGGVTIPAVSTTDDPDTVATLYGEEIAAIKAEAILEAIEGENARPDVYSPEDGE